MVQGRGEERLGGGVDNPYVRCAQPPEILFGDGRQRRIPFEGDDFAEAFREVEGIDAQSAGKVEHRVSAATFAGRACLARGLFESQRREDAAGFVVGGEFRPCPCEVFDLRGDECRMRNTLVEGDRRRVAANLLFDGMPHFGSQQQSVLFRSHHSGSEDTDFFRSALHRSRVAKMKSP